MPAPSPTPTPTPSPTGAVASYQTLRVPGARVGDSIQGMVPTNAGLYVTVRDGSFNNWRVLKLRIAADGTPSWIETIPDRTPGTRLNSVAPANPYSETLDEVSYYWSSLTSTFPGPPVIRWGYFTQGGAGQNLNASAAGGSDIDPNFVRAVAGGSAGEDSRRSWIIYNRFDVEGGAQEVYQDDGIYQGDGSLSDRFSKAATPTFPAGTLLAAIADPTRPLLYVGGLRKLYIFNADALQSTIDFPDDRGVGQFVFYQGKLYFSYGRRIHRLDESRPVFLYENTLSSGNSPVFCIFGDRILSSDGKSISISSGTMSRWIDFGDLNTQQQRDDAGALRSAAVEGISCSPDNAGPVYLRTADQSGPIIYAVTPL